VWNDEVVTKLHFYHNFSQIYHAMKRILKSDTFGFIVIFLPPCFSDKKRSSFYQISQMILLTFYHYTLYTGSLICSPMDHWAVCSNIFILFYSFIICCYCTQYPHYCYLGCISQIKMTSLIHYVVFSFHLYWCKL